MFFVTSSRLSDWLYICIDVYHTSVTYLIHTKVFYHNWKQLSFFQNDQVTSKKSKQPSSRPSSSLKNQAPAEDSHVSLISPTGDDQINRCLSPDDDNAPNAQCDDNSITQDDDDLMQAVQRIQRQAALTAAVNPWCYNPPNHLPPSILFGLQGMRVTGLQFILALKWLSQILSSNLIFCPYEKECPLLNVMQPIKLKKRMFIMIFCQFCQTQLHHYMCCCSSTTCW